jgi:Ni,Fe-hydrogenase III component G
VPPEALVDACARQIGAGARLLTVVATDERERDGVFRLRYLFAAPREGSHPGRITSIELRLDAAHPSFPSVTAAAPAVHWDEREVRDLFGLEPRGHPDPRRLVLDDDWPDDRYPLRRVLPARPRSRPGTRAARAARA